MSHANRCIAVVDDEVPVRTMLGRLLRLADYDVTAFASGEMFLNSLATEIPACVILDIHLPGLSGFDVYSRLRAAHATLPVIFITASDDPAIDHIVTAVHGAVLLRKPFSTEVLLGEIGRLLAPT